MDLQVAGKKGDTGRANAQSLSAAMYKLAKRTR